MNEESKLQKKSIYPGVSDRIKAAVTDSFVLVGFMFIAAYFFSQFEEVPDHFRMIAFVFIFGFYDPIFTSFLGGTIGHMAMGIRVRRREKTEKRIIFPVAILRFVVKFFLGIFSLFTVGSNKKHLAIHDLVAASVVVYKIPKT